MTTASQSRVSPAARRRVAGVTLALLLAAAGATVAETGSASAGALRAINGTELWVHRMGAGEPIVVVHGGPMLDHSYLLPHLEPLAEGYELVLYDQRLSGRSAAAVDPGGVTLDAFVADLEALRTELRLGRIHLLAHSFGAVVALKYALAHGDQLRSLVLVGPMAGSAELWRREQAEVAGRSLDSDRERRQAILGSEAFAERRPEAIAEMLALSFELQLHDREAIDRLELYVPDDYLERSQRFGALRPELESFDLHPGLAGVEVPTLLLYGEAEPGSAIGGPALAAALPSAELVTLPESGHFPFLERPEAFLAAVRAFLERAAGDGSP